MKKMLSIAVALLSSTIHAQSLPSNEAWRMYDRNGPTQYAPQLESGNYSHGNTSVGGYTSVLPTKAGTPTLVYTPNGSYQISRSGNAVFIQQASKSK